MQEYKTLKDLAEILSIFNNFQLEEVSVADISKQLDMAPSKVSRMLGTLERDDFFSKNLTTGKYRLGLKFFELGIVYAFHFPNRKIIRPHIEEMAKDLGFTASWAILKRSKIIVVDRVQNLNVDLMSHRLGLNLPIHSTSIGKVLLAYLPEDEQERILSTSTLTKYTDTTVVDPKKIKEILKHVREQGYATDRGETHADLNCIAAPIRDASGHVVAAINLMHENSKFSAENLFSKSGYLKDKALFISRQLGYGINL